MFNWPNAEVEVNAKPDLAEIKERQGSPLIFVFSSRSPFYFNLAVYILEDRLKLRWPPCELQLSATLTGYLGSIFKHHKGAGHKYTMSASLPRIKRPGLPRNIRRS